MISHFSHTATACNAAPRCFRFDFTNTHITQRPKELAAERYAWLNMLTLTSLQIVRGLR